MNKINRRNFLKLSAAGLIGSMISTQLKAAKTKGPNIVFIMADDMGYGDVQVLNPKSKIPTPNLNKIASEGMIFTDAHSGSAVCSPTRYGVVTGRYSWRTRMKRGVLNGYSTHLIDPERTTVADVLKQAGYNTACIGKWHLGMDLPLEKKDGIQSIDQTKKIKNGPNANGFDYFYGVTASLDMPPYVFVENEGFDGIVDTTYKGTGFPNYARGGLMASGFSHEKALDQLTSKSIDFIKQSSKKDAPFFLYFPLTAPHKPCLPEKRFRGNTKLGDYGDFVTQVDWVVGQIDKALQDAGISDNTLMFYTSDNGSYMYRYRDSREDHVQNPSVQGFNQEHHTANYIFRGTKADIWEAGHHLPYFVRWPGKIKAGSRCDKTICHTDLLATCAEIVGYKIPGNVGEDSFSIVPLLTGNASDFKRAPVIHHSGSGMFALRDGKWKMVFGNGSGGREKPKGKPFHKPFTLFNLEKDPSETNDVIDEHPDIAQQMAAKLDNIMNSGNSKSL